MHTDVHETIPDWMDKPIEELAGKRAIAITVGGTTIDANWNTVWRRPRMVYVWKA